MSGTQGVGGPAPVATESAAPAKVSPCIVEWPGAGDPTGGKVRTPESRCNKTDANGNVVGSIIARTDGDGTHVVVRNNDGSERPANPDEIKELDRHMQATTDVNVGAANFAEYQVWEQQRAAVSIQAGTYGVLPTLEGMPPAPADPFQNDGQPLAAPQQSSMAPRGVTFGD